MKQSTAIDVADALVNEFICIFGAPRILLTDQGSNFLNSLMKNVARKFKITQNKTTAYHPQSNGSVERTHHVLWEYLKQYTSARSDWDEHVRLAIFSYNTSVHEGTRYIPHELVFGKLADVPSIDNNIRGNTNESYTEYLTSLFNRVRDAQEIAARNLNRAKERSKYYYDRQVKPQRFEAGNSVYLLKEPSKGKLGNQYIGPYDIIQILPKNNVKLAIGDNRTRIVHQDKIRLNKAKRPTPT